MTSLTRSLFSLPYAAYKREKTYYLQYDALYLAGGLVILAVLFGLDYQARFTTPEAWMIYLFLPVLYGHIICSVFIHNAVHGNFPKTINRIVGEILGVIVLTRFASWEIVHRRHHRYSDDRERDPHPIVPNFWKYALFTVGNVERQLQQEYFDLYGENTETRRYEKWRARFSYLTNIVLLLCWWKLLGTVLFFAWLLPINFLGGLFIIHFNWSTHNGMSKDQDYKPVNIDSGYFWWGNRLFFGIYMHENHHRMARVFNPLRMKSRNHEV